MIMLKRESHHLATISPAFQQALSALRKLFVFNMQLLLCSSRMHSCSLGSLCQQSPDHLLSSTYNITVYIYIYIYIYIYNRVLSRESQNRIATSPAR